MQTFHLQNLMFFLSQNLYRCLKLFQYQNLISILFLMKKDEKFFILLIILTFIFSFAISLYHFGIEQGFFQESAVCGVENFSESITKEELLNKLSKKIISCKDVTFRVFGLSLTTINMVVSILFIITLGKFFINYEKNK